jgi:hypothetical protein
MVGRKDTAKDGEEGVWCQAAAAGDMRPSGSRKIDARKAQYMNAKCSDMLTRRAIVLADWADRMPLRDVYIFGDHAGADAGTGAKMQIAIEYSSDVSDEMMRSWQRENSTDFAELRNALGTQIALYADQDYDVWPAIRDAVRDPLMTIRKVRVVQTPAVLHARQVGDGLR